MAGHRDEVVFLLVMLVGALPTVTHAAQCADRPGGLFFLGRSPDNARSYWLSATNEGAYRLSAPGAPDTTPGPFRLAASA